MNACWPIQQHVALAVPLELEVQVQLQRLGGAEEVHLHRVIDDQIDGDERFDHLGITSQPGNRGAHGGEVDEQRNAGEILENDAGDNEGNFDLFRSLGIPVCQGLDVFGVDLFAVAVSQDGFQDDADADG